MKKHFYTEAILKICYENHLTVDEIFNKLQKKFPNAGRSSVYRNITELSEKGLIKKVVGDFKKALYEKRKEPHAHLICEKTGSVKDIPLDEKMVSLLKIPEDFSVDDIDVCVYGGWEE